MAFVNMFNDRVEQFNLREENERLAELFSDEKLQEEAQCKPILSRKYLGCFPFPKKKH